MEPLTIAITAALSNLSKEVTSDAYSAFKTLLARKFGTSSPLVLAANELEKQPDSSENKQC